MNPLKSTGYENARNSSALTNLTNETSESSGSIRKIYRENVASNQKESSSEKVNLENKANIEDRRAALNVINKFLREDHVSLDVSQITGVKRNEFLYSIVRQNMFLPLNEWPSEVVEVILNSLEAKFHVELETLTDFMKKDVFLPLLTNILERIKKDSWTRTETKILAMITQKLKEFYDDNYLTRESTWISRDVLKEVKVFFELCENNVGDEHHCLKILKNRFNILNLECLTQNRDALRFVRENIRSTLAIDPIGPVLKNAELEDSSPAKIKAIDSTLHKTDIQDSKRFLDLLCGAYKITQVEQLLGEEFFSLLQTHSLIFDVIELFKGLKSGLPFDAEEVNRIADSAYLLLSSNRHDDLEEPLNEVFRIFNSASKEELLENLYTSHFFFIFSPGAREEARPEGLRSIGSKKRQVEEIFYVWNHLRRNMSNSDPSTYQQYIQLLDVKNCIAQILLSSEFSPEIRESITYIFQAETVDDLFERMYSSPVFHQISLREDELCRLCGLVKIGKKRQAESQALSVELLRALSDTLHSMPSSYLDEIDEEINKELSLICLRHLNMEVGSALRIKISKFEALKMALKGGPVEGVDCNLLYEVLLKIKSFYFRKSLFYDMS